MIKQVPRPFKLDISQVVVINKLRPFNHQSWNNKSVKEIKKSIHVQLLKIQENYCGYCGLKVNEGGRAEIDHIAKQASKDGRKGYPSHTFTNRNLVISCQFCNCSSKKGQIDVVTFNDNANYRNCRFSIVHPYFDDPKEHYQLSGEGVQIIITPISDKAKESVRIFGLNEEGHALARAKDRIFERKKRKYELRQSVIDRIKRIMQFRTPGA